MISALVPNFIIPLRPLSAAMVTTGSNVAPGPTMRSLNQRESTPHSSQRSTKSKKRAAVRSPKGHAPMPNPSRIFMSTPFRA